MQEGDRIAVLNKVLEEGEEWWYGALQSGQEGTFPVVYVEEV